MNKIELISEISKGAGLTVADSRKALDALIDTVTKTLASGDKIQLLGFGTFKVTDRKARVGRNPSTGEQINIPACKLPTFTAGSDLKNAVNK